MRRNGFEHGKHPSDGCELLRHRKRKRRARGKTDAFGGSPEDVERFTVRVNDAPLDGAPEAVSATSRGAENGQENFDATAQAPV